jgi:hypothetical protein
VLTGRYKPDRGSVVLDGRDITGRRPQEIVGLGVAHHRGAPHFAALHGEKVDNPADNVGRPISRNGASHLS